jgi:hypothetical protein
MPIISTKRLRLLVREEVGAIVRAEMQELHQQVRQDAKLHIDSVQYKMTEDKLQMAQNRNTELVQANRELVWQVSALKQILSGQAHEALRLALDGVVEKCKNEAAAT